MQRRFILFVSLQGVYAAAGGHDDKRDDIRPGAAQPPAFAPPQIVHDGRRVLDTDLAALRAGVRPDQRLREAAYHVPDADQHRYDAARYRSAAEAVWHQAAQFSPRVEPLDGLHVFLDLTGAPNPAADARALLEALVPQHAAVGRAGLASSRFTARLAAETADWGEIAAAARPVHVHVVPPGDDAAFLAPLPLAALWPLPAKLPDRLTRLGLTSLDDIVRAGEGALCARLGHRDGMRVFRLASGLDPAPVAALYPPRIIAERRSLPEPSGDVAMLRPLLAEAAETAVRKLVREARAAGYAEVEVELAAGAPIARQRTFRRPQADTGSLIRALHALFAGIDKELPRHEGGMLAGADVRAVTARLGHIRELQTTQLSLLDGMGAPTTAAVEAESRLRDVLDAVRRRFPRQLLHRGRDLKPDRREAMLRLFDPLRGGPPDGPYR